MRFLTIGVYGFTEQSFFGALQQEGVDVFCDIRWRRGVRGAEYRFANSARLQGRLAKLGISYVHFRELAPPPPLRRSQAEADRAQGTGRRQRTHLSQVFTRGYSDQVLSDFNSKEFADRLGPGANVVAFCCVEREPAACHRSLLAERLARDLRVPVKHLTPPPSEAP